MIYFSPGPAKVYDGMKQYMIDAFDQNIMSISHRGSEFVAFSKDVIDTFHSKLNVPADFTVMYTCSATENWEIIPQSLVKAKTLHFYNGDFGKKWFEYSKKIHPQTVGSSFDINQLPDFDIISKNQDAEILCLTQNETSTSTHLKPEFIKQMAALLPNALVAIDATSCLAGIQIDYNVADIVFASVQKCFGMPSGLGVLICSPKAIEKAKQINDKKHYNSLLSMVDKIKDYQTTYTPNVLGIYLLSRVLKDMKDINTISKHIEQRSKSLYEVVNKMKTANLLITNQEVQSDTVIGVKSDAATIDNLKKMAKAEGLFLGAGYGDLKSTTFRIANFPAITDPEMNQLLSFLAKN